MRVVTLYLICAIVSGVITAIAVPLAFDWAQDAIVKDPKGNDPIVEALATIGSADPGVRFVYGLFIWLMLFGLLGKITKAYYNL